VKNRIWRQRSYKISNLLQLVNGWSNDVDFLAPHVPLLSRMGIQACHGHAWIFFPSQNQEILEQAPNTHNFLLAQQICHPSEWYVSCHKRNSQRSSGQAHREILST
jgi:hypothetical protein